MYIIKDTHQKRIGAFGTLEDAFKRLLELEEQDRFNGCYKEGKYMVDDLAVSPDWYSDEPGFGFTLCGR